MLVLLQFHSLAVGINMTKGLLLSPFIKESCIKARMRGKSCHIAIRMKSLPLLILPLVYIKKSQSQIAVSRDHSICDQPLGAQRTTEGRAVLFN